jgi:hypothetical protein
MSLILLSTTTTAGPATAEQRIKTNNKQSLPLCAHRKLPANTNGAEAEQCKVRLAY